jgi:hypothetical protein
VSELLGVSRRTVGRTVDPDFVTALHDADVVDQARTCLANTASHGSTAEEREAAEAWLVHAVRDEQQVEQFHQRTSGRRPRATANARAATAVTRNGASRPVKRSAATPVMPGPLPAVFARDQLNALARQQQRILHRSTLIDFVLTSEKQGLTLGDALAELWDITEAARTIGTILQTANREPNRHGA